MNDAATSAGKLWVGVLLPPASWIVELLVRYMATRWSHQHTVVWPLRLVTLLCLAALGYGALICWRALSGARRPVAEAAGRAGAPPVSGPSAAEEKGNLLGAEQQRQNRATLAGWGLGLAAFFLLLILAQAYPVLVLNVGEIT